jgi:hypothetical protein
VCDFAPPSESVPGESPGSMRPNPARSGLAEAAAGVIGTGGSCSAAVLRRFGGCGGGLTRPRPHLQSLRKRRGTAALQTLARHLARAKVSPSGLAPASAHRPCLQGGSSEIKVDQGGNPPDIRAGRCRDPGRSRRIKPNPTVSNPKKFLRRILRGSCSPAGRRSGAIKKSCGNPRRGGSS